MRGELRNAQKVEETKKNINDSKFRAVAQHMDYDGFKNMVLGADLKCVKAGAAFNMHDEGKGSVLNTTYKTKEEGFVVD